MGQSCLELLRMAQGGSELPRVGHSGSEQIEWIIVEPLAQILRAMKMRLLR